MFHTWIRVWYLVLVQQNLVFDWSNIWTLLEQTRNFAFHRGCSKGNPRTPGKTPRSALTVFLFGRHASKHCCTAPVARRHGISPIGRIDTFPRKKMKMVSREKGEPFSIRKVILGESEVVGCWQLQPPWWWELCGHRAVHRKWHFAHATGAELTCWDGGKQEKIRYLQYDITHHHHHYIIIIYHHHHHHHHHHLLNLMPNNACQHVWRPTSNYANRYSICTKYRCLLWDRKSKYAYLRSASPAAFYWKHSISRWSATMATGRMNIHWWMFAKVDFVVSSSGFLPVGVIIQNMFNENY